MRLPPKKSTKGFTLIEIVVALFVVSVLSGAIIAFSRGIFRTSSMLRLSISSQTDIRKTFKSFTSEVRSAAPGWDGSYPVGIASSTTFAFYANIDKDKYTEKVRYYISGSSLKKGVTKFNINSGKYDLSEILTTEILSVNATSGTRFFSYFDKNYDGTETYSRLPEPVDLSRVRLIRFDVSNSQYGKYIKSSDINTVQVSLRNLKDNY